MVILSPKSNDYGQGWPLGPVTAVDQAHFFFKELTQKKRGFPNLVP